ncbi:vitamin K epoxide reductase family protein [Candidatus Gracilibacteria bacterium]|nr:vitamin K epoxide reductase family protein [Candidatus Gracilibacteria bacterium]
MENKPSKYLIWAFLILATIGFIDASYLTVSHLTGSAVNCSVTGGCDTVLASKYSEILGIPLSYLGLAYYATIFFIALYYLDGHNKKALQFLTIIPLSGFAFSLYLVYLQFFIIEAICQYCMVSAINSTILAILGLFLLKFWRKK